MSWILLSDNKNSVYKISTLNYNEEENGGNFE